MESPEVVLMPMSRLMPILVSCIAGLLLLFIAMALVRLWGLRMQAKPGACGGLDVDELRRQRDAGEISQEEFDAVCGSLVGNPPDPARAGSRDAGRPTRAEGGPQRPIKETGADHGDPERTGSNGQDG
jgi:hypothetical protein